MHCKSLDSDERIVKVLPFGLSSTPCMVTKIMKPVVATLRSLGVLVALYLDDMLVFANCRNTTREHK